MSKIANYLKDHLRGEIVVSDHGRSRHTSDNGIMGATPMLIIHPYDINDIRKTVHFAWQLAQKGYTLPVTVRGGGTSTTGSTTTNGVVIDCTTHLNQILELDTHQKLIRVQPGLRLDTLQQTLRTHGLEWPVGPVSQNATVGGVIASQLVAKRGTSVSDWIDQIELVLASGEVLQVERSSKRELSKKRGIPGSEGELYRAIDNLLNESDKEAAVSQETTQFNLVGVQLQKNVFDLISLISGSQGALGIISEVILVLDTLYSDVEVLFIAINSLDQFDQLLQNTLKLSPDAVQYIPMSVISYLKDEHNIGLNELIEKDDLKQANGCLFVTFRGGKSKQKAKKVAKWFDKAGHHVVKSDSDFDAAREITQIQHTIEYNILSLEKDHKIAVPFIDDAQIDGSKAVDLEVGIADIAKKHRVTMVWWVDVLANVVTAYPLLNLKNLTDRQKVPKIAHDYYEFIMQQGGAIVGRYNIGNVKKMLLSDMFSDAQTENTNNIKKIFDEYNILNPEFTSDKQRDITKHMTDTYVPTIHLSTTHSI